MALTSVKHWSAGDTALLEAFGGAARQEALADLAGLHRTYLAAA